MPARLPAACVSRVAKVNWRQQVRFAGNWYSVPPRYVGQVVTVWAYVFRVEIAWRDQVVASHSRSYGRKEEVLNPPPLPAGLAKEAGRFSPGDTDAEVAAAPVYEAHHRRLRERREGQGGTREYIRILMLLQDHALQEVTAAVVQAASCGLYGYESARTFLGKNRPGNSVKSRGYGQPGGALRPAGKPARSRTMEKSLLLEAYLKRLRLPAIGRHYQEVTRQAVQRDFSFSCWRWWSWRISSGRKTPTRRGCHGQQRHRQDPLATALGLMACQQGKKVRFLTAAGLINQLAEAQAGLRLSHLERSLSRWIS